MQKINSCTVYFINTYCLKVRKLGFKVAVSLPELKGHIELKETPHWRDDFAAFLAAKKLWEWENVEMLKRVGYFLV